MPELTEEALAQLQAKAIGDGSYIDRDLHQQAYLVIARSYLPEWRGFIFQMPNQTWAISEDVPPLYRAALIKEVEGIGFQDTTSELSLIKVVQEGPQDLEPALDQEQMQHYLSFRKGFMERLIAFGKTQGWNVNRFRAARFAQDQTCSES